MGAKDDHDLFTNVAEMLGLEDEEADSFISSAMKRRGHKAVTQWADSEGDSGNGGGDFFSQRRQTRNVGGKQGKGNGSDWQYRNTGS
jgi:hypothetical protein